MYDPLYDPRIREEKQDYVPVDLVPAIAQRNLRTTASLETFNALYRTVIDNGMTTEQKISEIVGKDGLRILRSPKSDPSPAQRRLVLEFIASLNPDEATGRKERWRHANPRPREERALHAL